MIPWPNRRCVLAIVMLVVIGAGFALVPVYGETIHRFGFGNKNTVLVRGDANVKVEEKEHDVSNDSYHSRPTSEHLLLAADLATGDSAFIHYHYDTPHAPVTAALSAGVYVKATKPGIQLRARVVFPKEQDPAHPESSLTTLIVGDTYTERGQWQKLTLTEIPALIGKHLPVLQTKIGRAVNSTGAYIDRLVLNVYTGPGTAHIYIDDLDIGPVKSPDAAGGAPGTPVKKTKTDAPASNARGRISKLDSGQLFVDGKPFFFRAVRHTGAPLHVLRDAGFDALWVPADVPDGVMEEANREGWLVMPSIPTALPASVADKSEAEVAALDKYFRKFSGSDVLFWDLGGGRVQEQTPAVKRTQDYIRKFDGKRPFSADVWDGFQGYSTFLGAVGAHRWPLFTSLELSGYRDWIAQRMALSSTRAVFWTWVQNHAPDWYVENVARVRKEQFTDPIGPHPEQVRLLAYIGVACGCQGLGFWSDQFLADSHFGRDRLQGMAILNAELEMLAPVLLARSSKNVLWLDTDHKDVKAALIRGTRGSLLLPLWLGKGSQYVPGQGAVNSIKVTVPLVPDGADPWRISPANVECLRNSAVKKTGGTELTINEFDLVTPIVFTNELQQDGLVAQWQDFNRKNGPRAARWAMDLAAEEYEKTYIVHSRLAQMGVHVRDADGLFQNAAKAHESARRDNAAGLHAKAFAHAQAALRPLRVIMRDHWDKAVATLDTPSASPLAVSFFSLPQHWDMFREVQSCKPTTTVLPGGSFEPGRADVPDGGYPVDAVPGWSARFGTLDRVKVAAGVVSAAKLADKAEPKVPAFEGPRMYLPSRPIARPEDGYVPPAPELGRGVLKLEVQRRVDLAGDGKPAEAIARPLERTFLAVESPSVKLPPGSLVRISAWIKVPDSIGLTADGVLFYDDVCGEPLAVRLTNTEKKWKQFHLYRRVPQSGQIALTMALTGEGIVYFDDVRIEPLVPAAQGAGYAARPPQPQSAVQPAGGVRQR
ncbi:hypothetical protein VT84_02630 [Gemmata sp. SH-PL17]|uniref:hypothetical protein n=1 Tax=Gemmata sp. SH-PL17 TaxID=1630693 RepID=UPI00078E437F|nr:hypothetical protein [Gemmata sp. SH-PL17]AMV23276.1 hypothetical protein VT84_02630 [Gemmata sp. SH-PL17]